MILCLGSAAPPPPPYLRRYDSDGMQGKQQAASNKLRHDNYFLCENTNEWCLKLLRLYVVVVVASPRHERWRGWMKINGTNVTSQKFSLANLQEDVMALLAL